MKDYTELFKEIRLLMHELKIGFWKIGFLIWVAIVIWRSIDPQVLEVVFSALGWVG